METTSRRDGEHETGGRSGIRQASVTRRMGTGLKGWPEVGTLWESSSDGKRLFDGANLPAHPYLDTDRLG